MQVLAERHRQLLDRSEQGEADDAFADDVLAFLDDIRLAGEAVVEPAERAQLRGLVRYWCGTIFRFTGTYPTITLLPADVGAGLGTGAVARRSPPPLLWLLGGGASVAVIAAALAIIGSAAGLSLDGAAPAATPRAQARVRYVLAEQGLGGESASVLGPMTFCRAASDLVFHFSLADIEPDTDLRWVLLREAVEVAAQPAAPYGDMSESLTVRLGPDDGDGFVPGHYSLSLTAAGTTLWIQTFEVLDIAPRVFGLSVSDVPASIPGTDPRREFAPGPRVLYLRYSYEGLCSGVDLSHKLFLDGELIQAIEQDWVGPAQGEDQAVFQAAAGSVLVPGEYQAVTSVSGVEQGRVDFLIR
jgi:hypothetical protein